MRKLTIHAGDRFGLLTVIKEAEPRTYASRTVRQYRCRCDCGQETVVQLSSLRSGLTKSCGCLRRERTAETGSANRTHGHKRDGVESPTYVSWRQMMNRCTNPRVAAWKYYGARGITVCSRWKTFANFLADMGERPAGLTLDRINTHAGYTPENCRWTDIHTQLANRRPYSRQARNRADVRIRLY
jgi:hypothetical protein